MNCMKQLSTMAALVSLALLGSSTFGDIGDDNTKVNQRDRAEHELTADQQNLNESDSELTRRIRKDLMSKRDLSTYAHNIKIITVNGKVTLKGPVRSLNEEKTILKLAQAAAGRSNVTNEISVVPEKQN